MGCYWGNRRFVRLFLPATSQLPSYVNKFLLATSYCLNALIFGYILSACAKEHLIAAQRINFKLKLMFTTE